MTWLKRFIAVWAACSVVEVVAGQEAATLLMLAVILVWQRVFVKRVVSSAWSSVRGRRWQAHARHDLPPIPTVAVSSSRPSSGGAVASPPRVAVASPPAQQPPRQLTLTEKARRAGVDLVPPSACGTYADIGGMETLKSDLRAAIEPLIHRREDAQALGVTGASVLLYGPPGTGKSFIARATAGEFGLTLLRVTAGDLMASLVGEPEQKVRALFALAKEAAPSLLLLDELDAVAKRRDGGTAGHERALLTELLRQLDELASSGLPVVVIGATNDVDALDPAAIRPGRFARRVFVDLPDKPAREAIIRSEIKRRRCMTDIKVTALAEHLAGLSAAAIVGFIDEAAQHSLATGGRVLAQVHIDETLDKRRGALKPTLHEPKGWDDLVLPDDTIRQLKRVVRAIEDPAGLVALGGHPAKGAVLYGPPGTGKTTVAKVVASVAKVNFIEAKGSELIGSLLGQSGRAVADLFRRARDAAPCVLFLDEADSLLSARGRGSGDAGTESDRVVNEFLAQLDGVTGTGQRVFVLAATNHRDALDPAVVRPGRLSVGVEIPLPDAAARLKLWRLFAGKLTVSEALDFDELAAVELSGAGIETACEEAAALAWDESKDAVGMTELRAALASARRVAA